MMKRQNIRTLFLIIGTFTYLLCGASFFDYAESKHEKMQRTALNKIENMIIRKYNISTTDFRILTTVIIKNVPHKAGVQWKFSGAFYFATTVLTTIGYGHSTPATYLGKSFCMLYALLGIPLGLVMFQSIGERLNTFVAFSLRFCKRCLRFKKAETAADTNSIPLSDKCLIISVSIISTLVMTIGAAVFSHWENWSYFDAFYYCFITLTTIGFGDYVALQKNSALQDKPEYVIFSLVFILFGLSVVSAAINLLVLRFLTMNTEDERRDEAEAALTAASGVRLEGDVITANGSIISGIIPMENYLHSTASYPPFTPSRYHVYNYPPSANLDHYPTKKKFTRSNQMEQDDLFSDQEYMDAQSPYENQENFNVEADSELMQETETSSNQPTTRPYFPKQVLISDSNSERTFNTMGSNLNRLKAHHSAEQSELSVSSSLNSSSKRRTSKVFCKTSNHLLSKQRKNYKHMISEEESDEDSASDRASVCSCTCYGNNQGSRGSEFWRSNKSKKSKKAVGQHLEMHRSGQTVILNRKLPSTTKRYKAQQRSSGSAKYKGMKIGRSRTNQEEEFSLSQLNKLNQFNQMESGNAETILRPHYYAQTPLSVEQAPPMFPLSLFYLPSNGSVSNQLDPQQHQQFIQATNEALIKQQQGALAMQSNQANTELTQLTGLRNELMQKELIQKELICNLSGQNNFPVSNLSSSDHVLNQLQALNMKNLSYFVESEKGTLSATQLNSAYYPTKRDQSTPDPIESEQARESLQAKRLEALSSRAKEREKPKGRDKSKEKKRKTSQASGTRRTSKSEQLGSSEYLLRSNEGIVADQSQPSAQYSDPKLSDQNEADDDDLLPADPVKLDTQRASI